MITIRIWKNISITVSIGLDIWNMYGSKLECSDNMTTKMRIPRSCKDENGWLRPFVLVYCLRCSIVLLGGMLLVCYALVC